MVELGARVWRVRIHNAATDRYELHVAVLDTDVAAEVAVCHPGEHRVHWLTAVPPGRVKCAGYGDWIPEDAVVTRDIGTLLTAPEDGHWYILGPSPAPSRAGPQPRIVMSSDEEEPARRKRPRVSTSPSSDDGDVPASPSESSESDYDGSNYSSLSFDPYRLFAPRSVTVPTRNEVETAVQAAFSRPNLARAILEGKTWTITSAGRSGPRNDACAVCGRQRILTYHIFGPELTGDTCMVGSNCMEKMVVAQRAVARLHHAQEVEKVVHTHVEEARAAVHKLGSLAEDARRAYGGGMQ